MQYSKRLQRLAKIVAGEKVKPVMNDLSYIHKRINYGRIINRRLHIIPFIRAQFYVLYKSQQVQLNGS